MILESLCSRRAGLLSVLAVIGLGTTIYPGVVRSETCVLASQHAGVTFPVEQIEARWACPLQAVISNYTTVNKVGPILTPLPEPVYRYLLDRPPMAAGLTNRLGLSLYKSEARGPGRFWCSDGEGTEGLVELVYQDPTNRVYHVEGTHTSLVLPDINGKAVVLITMNPVQDGQGNDAVETTLVAYAKLNSRVLAGLVSLIRPLIGNTITRKLTKGFNVVNRLGQEMRQHSDRVLFEATDPPPLPHDEVAFLKQALEQLSHAGSAPQLRMPQP